MGTNKKKNDFIKIRVSQEQKELYKEYAAQKGISLTELLCVSTDELIVRDKIKHKEAEQIEPRLERLERELTEVKKKMEQRKQTRTKGFKWFK